MDERGCFLKRIPRVFLHAKLCFDSPDQVSQVRNLNAGQADEILEKVMANESLGPDAW